MTPTVVVDINVVVSGLLTRDSDAPTALILDAMLTGTIRFVLSVDLLAEYSHVLRRPRIRSRHRLSDDEIDSILTSVVENGMVREAETDHERALDRGDDHSWALLTANPGISLVTGDILLLKRPPIGTSAMSPRAFQRWRGSEAAQFTV